MAVKQLSADVNIPYLTSTAFKLEDADILAQNALKDASLPTNPIQPSKEQIIEVMVTAYSEGIVKSILNNI